MTKSPSVEKVKHIHDDPRIDCPACTEWVRSSLRIYPTYPTKSPSVEEIRERFVKIAIDSKHGGTEWGGLELYTKTLDYLKTISSKEKGEGGDNK